MFALRESKIRKNHTLAKVENRHRVKQVAQSSKYSNLMMHIFHGF